MTIEKAQKTLFRWLGQFGAVHRNGVPPDADPKLVHMDVPQTTGSFARSYAQPVYLYAINTTSAEKIVSVADAIKKAVGESGMMIRGAEGVIRIELGTPLYQDRVSPDKNSRAGYLLLEITIY